MTNLVAGQTYQWVVNGICTNGDKVAVNGTNFVTPTEPACSVPTNLSVDRITNVGARFNWDPTTNTKKSQLYTKTGTGSWYLWPSVPGDSTSVRAYDLRPNTTYSWYIQTVCNNGDIPSSKYYGPDFTTNSTEYCSSPSSLSVTQVADTGATLNWVADTSSTVKYYEVEFRKGGSSGAILFIKFKKVLSLRASNLLPNTEYFWKVRTHCTNADRQPWVSGGTFTTNCQSPTIFSTTDITGKGATLNWNKVSAKGFAVRVKDIVSSTWNYYPLSVSTDTTVRLSDLKLSTTYEWQVLDTCLSGNVNPWRNAGVFTTLATPYCADPSGLSLGTITSNGAVFNWTPTSLVGQYTLAVRNTSSPSNSWTAINVSGALSTYTVNFLSSGVTYEWRMKNECTNGDQNNDWILGANFTTVCASPSGLDTSSVTGTGATLNWAIDNTNVSKFEVQIKTVAATTWTNVSTSLAKTALNIRVSTLSPSTPYVWRIRSTCSNNTVNNWIQSNEFTTKGTFACSQPTSLATADITSNGADLTWVGGTSIATFDIEYKTSAATTWTRISGLSSATTSRRLTTLIQLTTYMWRVRSVCSNGDVSPWVNGADFTTTAEVACQSPTSLHTSDLTANGATLNWSLDTTGLGSVQISYKLTSSSTWGTAVTLAKGATSYRLSTLAVNTSYDWRIRTVCSNGDVQAFVTASSFLTTSVGACQSATGLFVSDTTSNGATLNWSLDTTGLKNMQISYKTSAGTTWGTAVTLAKGATSYRLSTLAVNTSYDWRIRTVCSNGDVQAFVTASFTTTNVNACNYPTSLTATSITSTGATLGWSIDTVGLKSMQLYYKLSSSATWSSAIAITKATTSYRLTGLTATTSYDWRIRTICSNNDVQNFVTSSFSTTNAAACNSPASLTATNLTASGATLGWTLDTTGLKNMQISYKTSAATTWGTAVTLAKAVTSYRLNTLTANTSYDWRIRTVCSNGDVQAYVTSNFTTVDTFACSQPSSLFTSGITTSAVTFNWTGGSNISTYDIQFKTVAATAWTSVVTGLSGSAVSRTRTGLTSGTTYMWRMRNKCTNTDINPWVNGTNFATLAPRFGDESFANNWTETINLYPNPSGGLVNIGVETSNELPIEITVLNALGQQVMSRNVTFTNDNNTTEFNLTALPAGMYFVKMKSAQKVVTRQLILENR
ncbi:T9SS type A sorting domain-containing protein [Flexibacter flexilis]|nr:fibronectin type III domain-containing protein [Flexibacter flexilis]